MYLDNLQQLARSCNYKKAACTFVANCSENPFHTRFVVVQCTRPRGLSYIIFVKRCMMNLLLEDISWCENGDRKLVIYI